jgi:membrane protease YdiL (CAAX protease family)
MKAIWARNTLYSKFLITVGIVLLSAVFFTIAGSIVATLVYGINWIQLQSLLQDTSQPNAVGILKIMQTFSAIGTFIIPPFLLALLFDGRIGKYLALDRNPGRSAIIAVILLMVLATPFINFLGEINSRMHLPGVLKGVENWMKDSEESAAKLTELFLTMNSPFDLIINLIMIAFIPAIGEELLFRGIIQRLFHQWSKNAHVAVWISAILFSAMHMQFYGFLPRMVLGAILGYMLVWGGSLWLPIIAHFVNNAAAVLFIYMYKSGISGLDPDKIGTENDVSSVLISIFTSGILFYLIYKWRKPRTDIFPDEENFHSNTITP